MNLEHPLEQEYLKGSIPASLYTVYHMHEWYPSNNLVRLIQFTYIITERCLSQALATIFN